MRRILCSWCVLLLVGSLGCERSGKDVPAAPGKARPASDSEAVARVGDTTITLAEFEEQLNQQNPLIRARYASLDQKKKLLDSLVEREAMVTEARRLGLENDPEMLRGYHKILARHLVNAEFNGKVVKDLEVPEADIQKYYEENRERYNAPEKVRAYLLFLEAPVADAARRKAARAKAAELHTKLKAAPGDRRLFLELAREHSADPLTNQTGGDTNFKTLDQWTVAYGAPVGAAAFGLKQANDLSEVLESDQGFYILRQAGRQAALDLPLEKVKGQIRTTLFAKARGEAYQRWVDEVKARAGVQVFESALAKARLEEAAAGKEPGPGGKLLAPTGGDQPPTGERLPLPPGALPRPRPPSKDAPPVAREP
jgi:parvulin-like peptidyl-prolyl isomerase